MSGFGNVTTSIGTTAAVIAAVDPANSQGVIKNQGPATVFVGGSTVTADRASTGGLPLEPGEVLTLPSIPGNGGVTDLYGVTASDTAYVSAVYI